MSYIQPRFVYGWLDTCHGWDNVEYLADDTVFKKRNFKITFTETCLMIMAWFNLNKYKVMLNFK